MFRLLVVPVSIGVLALLLTCFLALAIVSEPGVVSYVAEFALYLSNAYFDTMPPIIAGYIAHLNLAMAGLTVGLLVTLTIQLIVITSGTVIWITKWIILWLQRGRGEEVERDLSPIDMDPRYMGSTPGKEILGRGIDSIDGERRT